MSQEIVNKLNNPEKLDQLFKEVQAVIEEDSVSEAKKLLISLEGVLENNPDIKKLNRELFSFFQGLINSLKFIILFDLPEAEIVSLIKNNFNFVLNHSDYDLKTKISYKIRLIYNVIDRDRLKNDLRRTLLENQEILINKKITVVNVEQAGTVSAWLKDYLSKVGLEPVNKLKFNEYLFSDQNAKNLSETERQNLKKLLDIFESLKLSSQSNPVLDESFTAILPNGNLVAMNNGQPEKIDPAIMGIIKELSEKNKKDAIDDVLGSADGLPGSLNTPVASVSSRLVEKSLDMPELSGSLNVKSDNNNSKIPELEKILENYRPGSLEYKAIQQEIKILKSFENRKNNVKQ